MKGFTVHCFLNNCYIEVQGIRVSSNQCFFMANNQFCETEFNKKALELFNISEICHDNIKINERDGKFYLSKNQIISVKSMRIDVEDNSDPSIAQCGKDDELISIEYHILFHPSYQVPALFFNAYKGAYILRSC